MGDTQFREGFVSTGGSCAGTVGDLGLTHMSCLLEDAIAKTLPCTLFYPMGEALADIYEGWTHRFPKCKRILAVNWL